ncbi:hypothetical protein DVJ83_16845 (plasmid) [Deinococcus wulumuqiensis]|uniref:Uncharacterized protein n=1 Tax=Deinococcus wulumuqiensis TaxID=980427 RepID=A0A345IM76_9DEIO|nr:hypothetical protein DVJ83_16845 [Deinococcus wulumuqiensis]
MFELAASMAFFNPGGSLTKGRPFSTDDFGPSLLQHQGPTRTGILIRPGRQFVARFSCWHHNRLPA